MKIAKSEYRAVYILYPRGVRTGGPEALHQLAAELRELGTPAFLVPQVGTSSNRRVRDYEHYGVPEAAEVVDLPGNAFVCPESNYVELARYHRVDRYCWWLSVDNFRFFRAKQRLTIPSGGGFREHTRRAGYKVVASSEAAIRPIAFRLKVQHLAQSAYAWSFLHSRTGVPPSMLSDYIASSVTTASNMPFRDPLQIAFNFAKGGDLVNQIIASNTVGAHWVPIRNMTRVETIYALQSSSIYLDLGHQPGKDRLPREAAANGAVTIVARMGAGAFSADFSLPYDHKMIMNGSVVEPVSIALNGILADLPNQYDRQRTFRHAIELEQLVFKREVRRIFIDRQFGSDGELEAEL